MPIIADKLNPSSPDTTLSPQVDLDGNGSVDFEELGALVGATDRADMLTILDVDGNRKVTAAEWIAYMLRAKQINGEGFGNFLSFAEGRARQGGPPVDEAQMHPEVPAAVGAVLALESVLEEGEKLRAMSVFEANTPTPPATYTP